MKKALKFMFSRLSLYMDTYVTQTSYNSDHVACYRCECTQQLPLTLPTADTITKTITSASPTYVTGLQVVTVGTAIDGAWEGFAVTVGPITCCETI